MIKKILTPALSKGEETLSNKLDIKKVQEINLALFYF